MAIPETRDLQMMNGYHPVADDITGILQAHRFASLLVLGPKIPDIGSRVDEVRHISEPSVALPEGVFWFPSASPAAVMLVNAGASPGGPVRESDDELRLGSALSEVLNWFDHLWQQAAKVPRPAYDVMDEVIAKATGEDGMVRARQFAQGQWLYTVFVGGRSQRLREEAIAPRPVLDSAREWVRTPPLPADRLAATLTRAKLEKHFTDTVFSFRATRTIFRPYQFKPVMKLLNSGSLRLLIADEVGLGKTIEAGLLWTELEARRRADRVLVVCPSGLIGKWQREMEERFGFELVNLDGARLADLTARLESNGLPRRAAYVCSVERLRVWRDLAQATELGLQFDLVIVDEAHVFRNTDTKSNALGGHISRWADALVFLSATPVNLRNQDLFNLLELLVPGEFQDLEDLRQRIEPNAVLHRITGSLLEETVSNATRRSWLDGLSRSAFGQVLMLRPEYPMLVELLQKSELTTSEVVQIKRLCSELHGLAAQVTRTRKIEVEEDKAVRQPWSVPVMWSDSEHEFYQAYYLWCIERAKASATPIGFAMQMPLRLAGSCLPEAAQYVLSWAADEGVADEIDTAGRRPKQPAPNVPPSAELCELASRLSTDTKLSQFEATVRELVDQRRQALIFTFSRRTLAYLERNLRGVCRVATLHGDVDKQRRNKIMADFRAGVYDVVVATKVASEGLDFEFCSVVINYDLPWNPMEIEQRIGRLDRIGQREEKIVVVNFTTPGTIESDILQRALDRIGVFEHAIGALEPIINSTWADVEATLVDFTLTSEQRQARAAAMGAAVAERDQALADVESAAPYLISSDGVDIEGLEQDLLTSGRYIGQAELASLVADWAHTYGGRAEVVDDILRVVGNFELSRHVQALVTAGERTSAEIEGLVASLRNEHMIHLSLDQESSRLGGANLLTATHPLVRAALKVPPHRQARFSTVIMDAADLAIATGTYLVQLSAVSWNGIRSLHEVWTATVDVLTGKAVDDIGDRLMAAVAAGKLHGASFEDLPDLQPAVDLAADVINARFIHREDQLQAENNAFNSNRRVSLEQVHDRRLESIEDRIATLRARGNTGMIPLFESQLRREHQRHTEALQDLDTRSHASLSVEDLAVCVVKAV